MNKNIKLSLILAFLFSLGSPLGAYAEGKKEPRFGTPENLEYPPRLTLLRPSEVVKTISIRPGMTIADIGAGSGLFTFLIADSLKGTGQVFATEVSSDMVELIGRRAREEGYKNVFSLQVKKEGMDDFYKQHEFDIIFLCEVFEIIWHPEEFFRELKPSLKKGDGRLYIIYFKEDSDFNGIEFRDFKNVMRVLTDKGEDFPIFKRLSDKVKSFVRQWDGRSIPPTIQGRIVNDLNAMLHDRFLFRGLVDYYGENETHSMIVLDRFVSFNNRELVQWLFTELDKNKVFDAQENMVSEKDKIALYRLYMKVISDIFQEGDRSLLDTFGFDTNVFPLKKTVISTMEAAGYAFVREYDILPMHYFLEFKRRD
jgi:ubiquinone/menaquinone biosynthesis C-methylase UbiE